MVFGCLVGLPLFFLLIVTCPIWGPFAYWRHLRGEATELGHMKSADRYIDWSELKLKVGTEVEGTLIFEQAQKAGLRIWWTADDIKALSPLPLPREEEIDYVLGIDCPFMKWLREHYTGPNGKALRTELAITQAPGFAKISDFAFTEFKNVVPAVRWIWSRPFEMDSSNEKDEQPN
jgi:hypothetical protein